MFDTHICLRLFVITIAFAIACFSTQTSWLPPSSNNDLPSDQFEFRKPLSVNPDHFGNFPESKQTPIFPLTSDTDYEELTCVGFNPILNLLEATIAVKLSSGYDGSLCTN